MLSSNNVKLVIASKESVLNCLHIVDEKVLVNSHLPPDSIKCPACDQITPWSNVTPNYLSIYKKEHFKIYCPKHDLCVDIYCQNCDEILCRACATYHALQLDHDVIYAKELYYEEIALMKEEIKKVIDLRMDFEVKRLDYLEDAWEIFLSLFPSHLFILFDSKILKIINGIKNAMRHFISERQGECIITKDKLKHVQSFANNLFDSASPLQFFLLNKPLLAQIRRLATLPIKLEISEDLAEHIIKIFENVESVKGYPEESDLFNLIKSSVIEIFGERALLARLQSFYPNYFGGLQEQSVVCNK